MAQYTKVRFQDLILVATPVNTGTSTTSFAQATIALSSFDYTSETEWSETTDNSMPVKQYEPGYRGLSGSLEGFYDQGTGKKFPFSDGDTASATITFVGSDALTIPLFQIKNCAVSGSPSDNSLKIKMDWQASGQWTQTSGTTVQVSGTDD
jgi:hypothetical protein